MVRTTATRPRGFRRPPFITLQRAQISQIRVRQKERRAREQADQIGGDACVNQEQEKSHGVMLSLDGYAVLPAE
jgi:hypothetical protein